MKTPYRKILLATIGLAVMPLLVYVGLHLLRPHRIDVEKKLFPGIFYQRQSLLQPRPVMMHIAIIDLNNPGIELFVTPGKENQNRKFTAQTTAYFLRTYDLQLAINGSFFYPFYSRHPLDFYPRSGDGVDVIGLAMSAGKSYADATSGWSVLCILEQNRVTITELDCPQDTQHAIAGSNLLVKDGKATISGIRKNIGVDKYFPRTAVAIDSQGKKLWLIVVDGRQRYYSEGVTLGELSQIVADLGVDKALNLDGGGSTTMVMQGKWGAKLLNAPIHTRIPMRQRPVANHLGVKFIAPKKEN